jgi:hypothetical protein
VTDTGNLVLRMGNLGAYDGLGISVEEGGEHTDVAGRVI